MVGTNIPDSMGESRAITNRDQAAALANQITHAHTTVRCDDRHAAGQCFDDDRRNAFIIRGEDEDIALGKPIFHSVLIAGEDDPLGEAKPFNLAHKRASLRPIPDDDKPILRCASQCKSIQQKTKILLPDVTSGRQKAAPTPMATPG
jgi:hypothetical protein